MNDALLRLQEVQELFQVSRTTVWRWHTERGLKVVRIGGSIRIRQKDLDAFVLRHIEKDLT